MAEPLVIENKNALGDVVVLSALFRDLSTLYPGKWDLRYAGHCSPVLWHNPHISKIYRERPAHLKVITPTYGDHIKITKDPKGGPQSRYHFLQAYFKDFNRRMKTHAILQEPRGDIHLTEDEKTVRPFQQRYWVIFPGWKNDATVKKWSPARWQQLVDALRQCGILCVQTGNSGGGCQNPRLHNVMNTVGISPIRDLFQLIYHAEGVICGITSGMHIAAALQKPCVVVAGGREPWWFEAYVNTREPTFGPVASGKVAMPHRYLHTETLLPCNAYGGCWTNKILPTEKDKARMYCHAPTTDDFGEPMPACTKLIEVPHVIEAVMQYYDNGSLPPIGPKPQIILPENTQLPAIESVAQFAKTPPADAQLVRVGPSVGHTAALQRVDLPAEPTTVPTGSALLHPLIGGKMTMCVLLYGQDYFDLHRKCINAILSTTAPSTRDLRIACNDVGTDTLNYLSRLQDQQLVDAVYVNRENRKKYPVMRQMFYDTARPIDTKWIVWFDDDSIAGRDPEWYEKLAKVIIAFHASGVRMIGREMWHGLSGSQRELIKKQPWYKGKMFQLKSGREAPNGDGVRFVTGGFWAIETAAMRAAQIPDTILGHNGGDYWIGAQLHQAGFKLKGWNGNKQFVVESSVPRRGLHELHPGDHGWSPGGAEDPARSRK